MKCMTVKEIDNLLKNSFTLTDEEKEKYSKEILTDEEIKKSKTKQSLGCWLSEFSYNNSIDCFMETREQSYFCFSVFWIVTLPFYAVMMLFYHIICLFSNIIKKNSEYQS